MPDPAQHAPLQRAADAFNALVDERGWGQAPLLLRVERGLDPDAGAELAVEELDGHPAHALLGFSAPIAWSAIGVSAEGWATPCASGDHGYRADTLDDARRERVRSLVLLDRDGLVAGRLRRPDGRVVSEAPEEGMIVDCLRRALGRRTSPPVESTTTLFAVLWLEDVLAASRRTHRPLTDWSQVVALHPAVPVLAGAGAVVGSGELVEAARALGRACDWTMVRQQLITGWRRGEIEARAAVWMDTGMISRWLLDRRPSVDELVDSLGASCPPAMLQRIRRALEGMDLTAHHPAPAPAPERRPDVA